MTPPQLARFNFIKKVITLLGGILLSDQFINIDSPIRYVFYGVIIEESTKEFFDKLDGNHSGKKLSIEDMHIMAAKRGGKFLSPEYKHIRDKYLWGCGDCEEHFESTAYNIKNNPNWCPCTKSNTKWTIEKLKVEAEKRGITLLETVYKTLHTKMWWLCHKCNKKWHSEANSVIKCNTGCPHCSQNIKLTIEEMQQIAISRNGLCLSKEYIDSHTKLKWFCNVCRKSWWALPTNVKTRGDWCPHCSHRFPLSIEEIQQIAISRNGLCLSTDFTIIKGIKYVIWYCNVCKNKWSASIGAVKNNNQWCPSCSRRRSKGEEKCTQILNDLGVDFYIQHKELGLRRRYYDFMFELNGIKYLL